jgi:hypothetical protein
LCLAACGGTDETINGDTLSGLNTGASVVLQNNSADNLALTTNGSFHFADFLIGAGTYNVTILTQPAGRVCTVTNGSGTSNASAGEVDIVAVTCVTTSSVAGTVSGLAAGTNITLSSGSELLPIAANGTFAFPGTLATGTGYVVTVATQPEGETCTVSNGTGIVEANVAIPIAVTCG